MGYFACKYIIYVMKCNLIEYSINKIHGPLSYILGRPCYNLKHGHRVVLILQGFPGFQGFFRLSGHPALLLIVFHWRQCLFPSGSRLEWNFTWDVVATVYDVYILLFVTSLLHKVEPTNQPPQHCVRNLIVYIL